MYTDMIPMPFGSYQWVDIVQRTSFQVKCP